VPHDQRPGAAQPLHDEVVVLGDARSEREGLRKTLDVQVGIDRHWDSVERTEIFSTEYGGLGRFRVRTRPFVEVVERPEDALVLLDPSEEVFEHFYRRHLPGPDQFLDAPSGRPR
jgi:hypothetical protein